MRKYLGEMTLKNYVPLIIILLAGAYLRLWRIREYMTFLGDEGRDVMVVRKMITELDITFLGPTASVGGFFLGPIYYYFMTPFLWLFGMDPVGPAVMVALFGIAAIYLVYLAGALFVNSHAGLMAASLYALSPLVIAHSRSSWNPNIVPFFSLLYIISLYHIVRKKSSWWYLVCGASIGVGIQLHYLFAFLLPVGGVYFLWHGRGIYTIKNTVLALIGFIVPMGPFLAFEIKNGFPNTRSIVQFLSAGEGVGTEKNPFAIILDVLYRLFARLVFFFPPPEQITINPLNRYWWWQLGIVGVIFASLGYVSYTTLASKNKAYALLLVWTLFGVGLFGLYQREIYDYYFAIMFALPFLLVGGLFSALVQSKYKVLNIAAVAALAYLVYFNWQGRPFVHPPNNQVDNVERIAREVHDATGGEPYNFALLTSGNSDHAYRYFLELWDHPPTVIYNPDIDPSRESVTDQLIVLCEFPTCEPIGHPLWEIAGFGPAEIETVKDIGLGMRVFRLVHVSL